MGSKNFDDVRKNGLLLYEYIRGSKCHGTDTEESDTDYGGIYAEPITSLLDTGKSYVDEIRNETNDIVWYELNKFGKLLLNSNPTILEALFVDDEFVLYESPFITEVKKNRDKFITKHALKSFSQFAISLIKKSRNLNKKNAKKKVELKESLDFCYTFYKQGSTPIKTWLSNRGLKEQYCGLVDIPNMDNIYSIYYDFGSHIKNDGITIDTLRESLNDKYIYDNDLQNFTKFVIEQFNLKEMTRLGHDNTIDNLEHWLQKQKTLNYRGLVDNNELCISTVSIDELPICYMCYNVNDYNEHCKKYKEYTDWLNNTDKDDNRNTKIGYNPKSMSEAFRIMNMCIEIANSGSFIVNRKNIDRKFLLDVKKGRYKSDELFELADRKIQIMDNAIEKSTLPDNIDITIIDKMLLTFRKDQMSDIKRVKKRKNVQRN